MSFVPAPDVFDISVSQVDVSYTQPYIQVPTYIPTVHSDSIVDINVTQNAESVGHNGVDSCLLQAVAPSGAGSWVGSHHCLADQGRVSIATADPSPDKRAKIKRYIVDKIKINNPRILSHSYFYTQIGFNGPYTYLAYDRSCHFSVLHMAAYSIIIFVQNLFQRFTSSLALSETTVFLNLIMSFLGNVIHKAIHNNHLLFLLFCNNSGLFPAFVANNYSSRLNNEGRFSPDT